MQIDPEGRELEALLRHVALDGARALELGSGDGRLTWRYAHRADWVVCREPDRELTAEARRARPAALAGVELGVARAEALDLADRSFNVALFSWSL